VDSNYLVDLKKKSEPKKSKNSFALNTLLAKKKKKNLTHIKNSQNYLQVPLYANKDL
jgi:hypothetical protein